jgi:hypothetical protein
LRVDLEIKKLINLAQLRKWDRDVFLSRIKQLWSKTEHGAKDTTKNIEHQKWINQIKL